MRKTRILRVGVFLFFLLALAACSGASSSTATPRPTRPPATATTAAATEQASAEVTSAAQAATTEAAATSETTAAAPVTATSEVTATAEAAVTAEATSAAATQEQTAEATAASETTATAEMTATAEAITAIEATATSEATTAAETTALPAGAMVTIAPDQHVILGFAAALSGEGLVPLGTAIRRGVELALEDRPAVTVGGKQFTVEMDAQDDQCSAEGGQTIANRFVSEGQVVGVVGPMCSSACRAAAPIFDAAGYTSVSPSCTNPEMTTGGFTSFNRSAVSDAFQGRVAAQYIYNVLGARKIATVHDGSSYGEGLVAVMSSSFEALGGQVVKADVVNPDDTDFRSLLEDVAAENPDLIYFGGFPAAGARLAQQRADAGLENVTFMGADGLNTPEYPRLAGDAANGTYASGPLATTSDALTALQERYIAKYNEPPATPYYANAYDAANMILDGIEAVGQVDASGNLTVDRAALAHYIRTLKNYHGVTGTMNCDGTGDCAVTSYGFYKVEDGQLVLVNIGAVSPEGAISIQTPTPEATATAEATVAATATTPPTPRPSATARPAPTATHPAPTETGTAEATASS